MCGRFVSPEEATIERYWHLGRHNFKLLPRRFNVFPTDTVQFLRRPSNSEGLELAAGRWGLVPHWIGHLPGPICRIWGSIGQV